MRALALFTPRFRITGLSGLVGLIGVGCLSGLIGLGALGCGSADRSVFSDDPSPTSDDSGGITVDVGGDSLPATDGGRDSASVIDSGSAIDSARPPEDSGVTTIDSSPPPDATVTKVCTVPTAKVFDGHCYFRIEGRAYTEAAKGCNAFSPTTHLATITSDGEQKVAASFGVGFERWIGMSRDVATLPIKASYKWITGEPVTYENWAATEPNFSGSCVRLYIDDSWADRDCTSVLTSICEEE